MGVLISETVVYVAVKEAERLGWKGQPTATFGTMRAVLNAAQEQAAKENRSFEIEDYRRFAEEIARERDVLQEELAKAKTLLALAKARLEGSAISSADAEEAYIQVRHLVNLLEGAGWIKAVQAFEALKRIVNTHSSQEGEQ